MSADSNIASPGAAGLQTNHLISFIKENATLIALLVLVVGLSFADDAFFTARNLSNLSRQVTIIGIIAVGMTMVILIAGIDLSVGSVVGLSAVVVTLLMQMGVPMVLAVPATLAIVGVGIGAWNGFWIAKFNIPPFIITLGMLTIARGLALTLTNGSSVPVTSKSFAFIGGAYIPPTISMIILAVAAALAVYSIFRGIQQSKAHGVEINTQELMVNGAVMLGGFALAFHVFTSYKGIPVPVAIFAVIAFAGIYCLNSTDLVAVSMRWAETRMRRVCRASTS